MSLETKWLVLFSCLLASSYGFYSDQSKSSYADVFLRESPVLYEQARDQSSGACMANLKEHFENNTMEIQNYLSGGLEKSYSMIKLKDTFAETWKEMVVFDFSQTKAAYKTLVINGKKIRLGYNDEKLYEPVFQFSELMSQEIIKYTTNSYERNLLTVDALKVVYSDGTRKQSTDIWHIDERRYMTCLVVLQGLGTEIFIPETWAETRRLYAAITIGISDITSGFKGRYFSLAEDQAIVFSGSVRDMLFNTSSLVHKAPNGTMGKSRLAIVLFWKLEGTRRDLVKSLYRNNRSRKSADFRGQKTEKEINAVRSEMIRALDLELHKM